MPTVTFTGPFATRRRHDNAEAWLRGQPVEVSQEWLNQWRNRLKQSHFRIEGDAAMTVYQTVDGLTRISEHGLPVMVEKCLGIVLRKNFWAW